MFEDNLRFFADGFNKLLKDSLSSVQGSELFLQSKELLETFKVRSNS